MDASVLKFECHSEDDGYNNAQLDGNINECDSRSDSDHEALHSQIFTQCMRAVSVSSGNNSQSSVMDKGLGEQTNAGNSRLWTPEGFQEASSSDNGTPPQPHQTSNCSQRPQKSTKMWLGNRRRKKWSSMYGSQIRCPHCPETFLHKRSLSRHIMINHGPKVYFWCKRCCRFYNRRDNLRSHYRSHHPKHIRDLDHIQGVGRESLLPGGQPSSSKTNNGPLDVSTCSTFISNQIVGGNSSQSVTSNSAPQSSNSSYSTSSTTTKVGAKPLKIQAAQLMEREKGAVGARQETLRIRTSFVNTRDCKSNAKKSACAAARQSGIKPTPERQLPTLSVPPAGVSQEFKRPSVKAHPILSADARGNPWTVRDVLAYQLQRESNHTDEDVVEISDDSSSDGELDPPPQMPSQGPRDAGVERLEHGTPFKDLQIEKVMEGQVTRVTEEHQTYIYSRGEKIRTERRKRVYNVLHLDGVGRGMNLTTQPAIMTSSGLTREGQLEKNVQGRVTKVTERSSKYTYSSGQKVMKEKTSRVYDAILLPGLTNI
ncbi:uncharacterized protein LOC119740576 [Patiria miniata]|uniref:C2H2-type domain-containing protein n=1 Tax=Patiria miniata TaxID=46514 RepID=A0A914B7R4_PATMI|nr:uncharacterized protein LOC119740576 [Patiria miniata]